MTLVPLVPLGPGEGMAALLERGESNPRWCSWLYWFRAACNAAEKSLCLRSKCGAVLVGEPLFRRPKDEGMFGGLPIGQGSNGPPKDDPAFRRCGETTPSKAHPKAGRTCSHPLASEGHVHPLASESSGDPGSGDPGCCVHAEVRAMLSAVPRCRVEGSTLYFARVDENGILLPSGRPSHPDASEGLGDPGWCTECSKLALDLGVKTWVLWHVDGPAEYDADHYDWLSNRYDAWVPADDADTAAKEST